MTWNALSVTQRRTLQKVHKPASSVGIPRAASSVKSDTTIASSAPSVIPKSYSVDRLLQSPPVHPVNIPFPSKIQSSHSGSSISTSIQSHTSSVRPSCPSALKSLQQQADDLDSEYRKQRTLNFPSEAIIAARKAVGLRRVIVSMDKNARTTGALAKSLTYLARCLRDLNNSTYHERELTSTLAESVARYKEAFRADTGFRLGLATALYNYSVCLAEKKTAHGLKYQIKESRGDMSLVAALDAAHESVHHFSILENEEPEMYGFDLANALLNLSFILSDLGKNDRALGTARRAVALSNQFVASLDDPTVERNLDVGLEEEREKRIQVLHRTLMRVSYCLEFMGMMEESAEAEQEANQVLESQMALIGHVSTSSRGGELLNHLRELHTEYEGIIGPVVRIGPNMLHFASTQAYHDIYTNGQSFTKYKWFYRSLGQAESSFSYIDPQESRTRRAMLNPLFSRRAILKLERVVQERVDILVERLHACPEDEPVNLSLAFRCVSLDVISGYCFANCFHALETPGFRHPIICAIHELLPNCWMQKHFPILVNVIELMPEWLVAWINPGVKPFLGVRNSLAGQVDKLLASDDTLRTVEHETIFHHLLAPEEKENANVNRHVRPTRKSLIDEALSLIGAGTDTAAWPDPDNPMCLATLEKLPYLTAVVKESLRLGHGVCTPLPRVVGPSNAIIGGFPIPAGAVVEMSSVFIHEDPKAFEDPLEFLPERWLRPETRDMERNFVPFAKGPRMCLGLNFAWCELYLIFADVFRKLDMEIADTTLEDITNYKEFLAPYWEGNTLDVTVQPRAD
uniref:Cytochrome p450 n=1 Tax=Moniliophthora roreri TaxID=221103 RepID=A0A0W0FQL4_MONRR